MRVKTEMKKIEQTSKYPKTNFMARLLEFVVQYNNKLQTDVLVLKFETGEEYNIPLQFENSKAKKDGVYGIHPDGSYDGFMSIGLFLESLQKLSSIDGEKHTNNNDSIDNIKVIFEWENDKPVSFETVPNVIGKVLHNVATPRKIDNQGEQSKYPDWTVAKVDLLETKPETPVPKPETPVPKQEAPAPKPKSEVPAPKPEAPVPKPETSVGLGDDIVTALIENGKMSVSALYTHFKTKYTVTDIRSALANLPNIKHTGNDYEVK